MEVTEAKCKTLKELDLQENDFSVRSLLDIKEALKSINKEHCLIMDDDIDCGLENDISEDDEDDEDEEEEENGENADEGFGHDASIDDTPRKTGWFFFVSFFGIRSKFSIELEEELVGSLSLLHLFIFRSYYQLLG